MSILKSNYHILKDLNLILEYHTGTLNLNSYIKFKQKLILNPEFLSNQNYFVDLKNVNFKISIEDIDSYVNFFKKNSNGVGKRKIALLTGTPNQVVFTTLYKSVLKNTNEIIEIFSTKEKALEWLEINDLTINNLIKNLEHSK